MATAGTTRISVDLALNTRGFRPLGRINGQLGEFEKSLDASNARVLAFGASAGAILAVRKAFTATVKAAIEVEKSLKDINVILQTSQTNLQKFGSELFRIASETGQAFSVAATAATELARQGLGVEETLKRTRDALVLARLSGLEAAEAVNALTAALNTFEKVGLTSTVIINKLANVDAAFAVSSEDLAKALGRVGSAAQSAGVDLDQLLAIVTTAQQKTARGGAVIGNSFKTIFTRIQRPRVIKELENLGVQVKSLEGDTLPAIKVLSNLAKQFDNLSSSQRAQITELVGGVFQVNVLKAALSDLNKEQGIYNRALAISAGSSDQALRRNEELNETLAAQFQKTLNTFKEAAAELGTLTLGPALENIFGAVNKTFSAAAGDSGLAQAGQFIGKTVFESIGKFIGGPGLLIIGGVLFKTFANLATFAADAFKTLTGLNKNFQNQLNLQKQIFGVLSENPDLMNQIRAGTLSVEDAHQLVLQRINEETDALDRQLLISQQIAAALSGGGVGFSPDFGATAGGTRKFGPTPKGKSGGYIPNFADEELVGMMMGGYSNSQLSNPKIRKSLIHNGKGGAFTAKTNGHEDIVDFKNSQGKKATAVIPPRGTSAFDDFTKALAGGFIPNFFQMGEAGGTPFAQARAVLRAGVGQKYGGATITKGDVSRANKYLKDNPDSAQDKAKKGRKKTTKPIGNVFDVGQQYGGLALFGVTGKKTTIRTPIKDITPFKHAKRPLDGSVYFKNFQQRSFLGETKNNQNEFSALVKKHMAKPMETITNEFAQAMGLRDDAPKVTSAKISTTGGPLFPPGAEGSIFETSINAMTKNAKSFESGLSGDTSALWDFEESGQVDKKFKKKFGYSSYLKKADAKRTLDQGAFDSIGNKIVSSLLNKDTGKVKRSNNPLAQQLAQFAGTAAGGFIPSFSALHSAVQRERSAGVPMNKIRVGTHKSLASGLNPAGLGVYNTRDEPSGLGQGVRRSLASGLDPRKAGVPNFAKGDGDGGMGGAVKLGVALFAAQTAITGLENSLGEATDENRAERKALGALNATINSLITVLTVKELFDGTAIGDKLGSAFGKKAGSMNIGDKIFGSKLQGPGLPERAARTRVGGLFGKSGFVQKATGKSKALLQSAGGAIKKRGVGGLISGGGRAALGGVGKLAGAAGPAGVVAATVALSEGINYLVDDVFDNASKELDSATIAFKKISEAAEKNINALNTFQQATQQAADIFYDRNASVNDLIKAEQNVRQAMNKLPEELRSQVRGIVDPAELNDAVASAVANEQQKKQDAATRKDVAETMKGVEQEGFFSVLEPGKMWDAIFKSGEDIAKEREADEKKVRNVMGQATAGVSDQQFLKTSNVAIADINDELNAIATGFDVETNLKDLEPMLRELGYSEEIIKSMTTAMQGDAYQRELAAEQLRNEINQRKRDADANAALAKERDKLLRVERAMQQEVERNRRTLEVEQKVRAEAMKITAQASASFLTAAGKIDQDVNNKIATLQAGGEKDFGRAIGNVGTALGESRLTTGLSGKELETAQNLEAQVQSVIAQARQGGVGSLQEGSLNQLLADLGAEGRAAGGSRQKGIEALAAQLTTLVQSSVNIEQSMKDEIKATRDIAELQKRAAEQARRLKSFGGSAATGNPAAMDDVISRLRGSSIAGGIARRTGSASGADSATVNRAKAVQEILGGELPAGIREKAVGAATRDNLRRMRNVNSMLAPDERMSEADMRKAAAEQAAELFKGTPLDANTEAVKENTKAYKEYVDKERTGQADLIDQQNVVNSAKDAMRDQHRRDSKRITRDADRQFNNLQNQARDNDELQDDLNNLRGGGAMTAPGQWYNAYQGYKGLTGNRDRAAQQRRTTRDFAESMDAGTTKGNKMARERSARQGAGEAMKVGDIRIDMPQGMKTQVARLVSRHMKNAHQRENDSVK